MFFEGSFVYWFVVTIQCFPWFFGFEVGLETAAFFSHQMRFFSVNFVKFGIFPPIIAKLKDKILNFILPAIFIEGFSFQSCVFTFSDF